MNNSRAFFICVILLLAATGFSQKNAKIIVDSKTKQPLDYVYVSSDDKSQNLLSNKDGKLVLVPDGKISAYVFYKIGYLKRAIAVTELLKTDTVFLTQDVVELDGVSITAKRIDTVVSDKRFYVNDYLVLPNNDVLLLTSKININGFEVAYFKKNRGITHIKKLKNETGEHFFADCFKNSHLVTNLYSREIFFDSDSSFDFLPKYSRAKFDSVLLPCALKLDSQLIVKQSLPPVLVKGEYVQHSYFLNYVKVSKGSRKLFYPVLYSKEIREMLMYEIFDEQFMKFHNEYDLGAFHALFFRKIAAPIYAPAFLKNDTVFIFNFQEMRIVALNKRGDLLSETAINQKNFAAFRDYEVIYDSPKQKFYLKTKKMEKACLQAINIYSGNIGAEIKLEKVFAKNIQVQNGKIYYLVKEKGWDDTCYLYQQN